MTTSRTQARAEVVAALTGLGLFAIVSNGLIDKFEKSPVAVVRSQSYERIPQARGLATYRYGLAVTVYVAEKEGTSVQVETKLDDLVAAVVVAVLALEGGDDTTITVEPSTAPNGDVLQQTADGKVWRVERIPITWETEG